MAEGTKGDVELKLKCLDKYAYDRRGMLHRMTVTVARRIFCEETMTRADVNITAVTNHGAFSDRRSVTRLLEKLGFETDGGKLVMVEDISENEKVRILMDKLTLAQAACLHGWIKELERTRPKDPRGRKAGVKIGAYSTESADRKAELERKNARVADQMEKRFEGRSGRAEHAEDTAVSVPSRDGQGLIRVEYLRGLATDKLEKRLENVNRIIAGGNVRMQFVDEQAKIRDIINERKDETR